jgi:SAM-dependent methyltransferase
VLGPRRERLLAGLTGDVLDVGAGTGVNLPYFEKATRVVAIEPSAPMRARLQRKAEQVSVPVEVCDATAEAQPCLEPTVIGFDAVADASFDAVVFTLALCTIPDPGAALAEARRVLKLGGQLVVLEHVRGEGKLARRQDRWDPVWSRFGAGCHPNRDTRAAIERAGFTFDGLEQFAELPRWVLTRTMLQGTATR